MKAMTVKMIVMMMMMMVTYKAYDPFDDDENGTKIDKNMGNDFKIKTYAKI